MKTEYPNSIERDITFEIGLCRKLIGTNNRPAPIIIGISNLKILLSTDKGFIIETNPNTDNIL